MDFPLKDRDKIKELLIQMNKLLTEHIEIHNAIFNPPLRAKIPLPFIMKKIDFKKQSEKALQINNSVDEHLKVAFVMNKFSKMNNSTYQTIYDYGQSFLLSSMKLSEIAHELYLKGERKNALTYMQFNELVNQYEEVEQVRLSYSSKINQLANEYFS